MRSFVPKPKPSQQIRSVASKTRSEPFFQTNHQTHSTPPSSQPNEEYITNDLSAEPTFLTLDSDQAASNTNARIQSKLTVSTPGDRYEREADRVADQVMRLPEPKSQSTAYEGMRSEHDENQNSGETQDSQSYQTRKTNTGIEPSIERNILRSPGRPLDDTARHFFEPRFHLDLGHLRVHTDEKSAEQAQALGARAFTLGNNIFFAPGEYSPNTDAGRRVLAHELTHTIQQSSAVTVVNRNAPISQHSSVPMFMRITDQESTTLLTRFGHWANQLEITNESLGYGRRILGSDQVAVIHIYDNRGQRHEFAGYHLTLQRANHAEQEAIGMVNLTRSQVRGGRMYIVISDTPCPACRQAIQGLAADLGLNPSNVEVFEVTRRSISDPGTYVRGTTALRTRRRHPSIPLELRTVRIFPTHGGGGSGGSLHGLAMRRESLIGELERTTRARQALSTRIGVYSMAFSSLVNLLGYISAVSDVSQMMSAGTTLREQQRLATRINSQAQEALEGAQNIDPGASFHLQTVSLISDAEAGRDSDTLFSIDNELYDFSVSLDSIVSEYHRLTSGLTEQARSLRETSDMFLQLAQAPQVGSTAGSASFVAMHQSLLRLSGTLRGAAERYGQAHQILNFAMESAQRYSQQANQAAWQLFGEAITESLAAIRRERASRESEVEPARLPASPGRELSETELVQPRFSSRPVIRRGP